MILALFAIAADLGARRSDLDAAIFFDLLFQLLVEMRLELADRSAFQACNVDVIAGPVAFVEMLAAAQVEQVELVDEAVAFEQIDGAVDRHAVDARIELLRAIKNRVGVKVAFGVVHDFKQNFSLARQAHAALRERLLQSTGTLVRVDALARGNSMCCRGHTTVRPTERLQRLMLHDSRKSFCESASGAELAAGHHCT